MKEIIRDYLGFHDRGDDRAPPKGGIGLYLYNHLKIVGTGGTIRKILRVDDNDTTTATGYTLGDGWVTADSARPSWIEVDATVETDGTSSGEVVVEVDEDGDGTADYDLTVAYVSPDNASGSSSEGSTKVYVPEGAQYRINAVSDPNAAATVNTARKVTA